MKTLKRIIKWISIFIISLLCVLSIIPYFFTNHLKEPPIKPYSNSLYFEFNHTKFHFRLFLPKLIKHKVMLIHGFSGSTFSFRNNIDSLVKHDILVMAIDMPAFGYSDKSKYANYTDSNTINAMSFLLKQIDKHSNSQKWNLIGHSMGGSVIAQFASRFKLQINSLIFIDGLPVAKKSNVFASMVFSYPPLLKFSDLMLEKFFLNRTSFQNLLSSAYSQNADSISTEGYMQPFTTKGSGSAIFRMAAKNETININDTIINSIPKLIIWGKNDTWIPIINASQYLNKPRTQFIVINNAGHCPMETHQKEVNTAVINFISKLD